MDKLVKIKTQHKYFCICNIEVLFSQCEKLIYTNSL